MEILGTEETSVSGGLVTQVATGGGEGFFIKEVGLHDLTFPLDPANPVLPNHLCKVAPITIGPCKY